MSIREHLRTRGVNPDSKGLIISEHKGLAFFLMYNLSGKLIGYQQYNPAGDKKHFSRSKAGECMQKQYGKYFTYVSKEMGGKKCLTVWGLEHLDINNPYLWITEGIFDCIKLINVGLPALAVLGTPPSKMLRTWVSLLHKKIIVILDSDMAGKKLTRISKKCHSFTVPKPYKDLGDMPNSEVEIFTDSIKKQIYK